MMSAEQQNNETASADLLGEETARNSAASAESDERSRAMQLIGKSQLVRPAVAGQLPVVYDSGYDISFLGLEKCHPFDAGKWGRIVGFLREDGVLGGNGVSKSTVQPKEATTDDLLVVHTKKYLNSLNWSANVARIMEIPFVACAPNFAVQRFALKRFRMQTGGTVAVGPNLFDVKHHMFEAAHLALEHGSAINVGGGFHHCSADRGGGFCAYADITLAIAFLLHSQRIGKAMIVDLDAHQGNGHARDFLGDKRVFIFDMYNADIYPHDTHAKAAISCRVELHSGCSTERYLTLLRKYLPDCLDKFRPDFVLYNAGTDCLEGDRLGNLDVSAEGIVERDAFVFGECAERRVPVCMVTSGGYQMNNARVIADSIGNLRHSQLLEPVAQTREGHNTKPDANKKKAKKS